MSLSILLFAESRLIRGAACGGECHVSAAQPTYTVGSWGETNYDERGYKSYNNKGVVVVKPEEPQPTKPTKPSKGN